MTWHSEGPPPTPPGDFVQVFIQEEINTPEEIY